MSSVVDLPLSAIRMSPRNARKLYTKIKELSDSISQIGLLENLVVRKVQDGYEVDAGNRRLRAMLLLVERGIWDEDHKVACKVITTSGTLEAFVENIQREDVSYWDMGDGFIRAIEEEHYTQRMIADAVGKTQTWVSICITIARGLAPKVRKQLEQMGPSRPNVSEIKGIAQIVDKNSLKPDEAKQMKALARIVSRPKRPASPAKARTVHLTTRLHELQTMELPAHVDALVKSIVRFLTGEDAELRIDQETKRPRDQESRGR